MGELDLEGFPELVRSWRGRRCGGSLRRAVGGAVDSGEAGVAVGRAGGEKLLRWCRFQLKGAFPYRRRPRAVDAAPCPSAEIGDFWSYHARIINSASRLPYRKRIYEIKDQANERRPQEAALLFVGAAMLTACAGMTRRNRRRPTRPIKRVWTSSRPLLQRPHRRSAPGAGIPAQLTELYYTESWTRRTTGSPLHRLDAAGRTPGQLVVEKMA